MLDPSFHVPITSNFSQTTLLLDVNITVNTTLTAHEEQTDSASINICKTV